MTAAANSDIKLPGDDEYANYLAATNHDRAALARMFGAPFRRVTCTTDDNTAAASSPILNLSSLGVTF